MIGLGILLILLGLLLFFAGLYFARENELFDKTDLDLDQYLEKDGWITDKKELEEQNEEEKVEPVRKEIAPEIENKAEIGSTIEVVSEKKDYGWEDTDILEATEILESESDEKCDSSVYYPESTELLSELTEVLR